MLNLVITAPPEITYDNSYKEGMSLKAGTSLIILVNIKGHPRPVVKWNFNGQEVQPSADVTIEGDGTYSKLTIKRTTGFNSGKYTVVAENEVGSTDAEFNVNVKGKPKGFTNIFSFI